MHDRRVPVRRLFGPDAVYEGKIYPFYAVLTGMAFFVLGSSYWGRLYAVGAGVLRAGVCDVAGSDWATLEFGGGVGGDAGA